MVFNKKIIGIGFLIFLGILFLFELQEMKKEKAPSLTSGGKDLGKLKVNFIPSGTGTWTDKLGINFNAKIFNIFTSHFPFINAIWYYQPYSEKDYWLIIKNSYINPNYNNYPPTQGDIFFSSSSGGMIAG